MTYHLLAEALRRGHNNRSHFVGDPDYFDVPISDLLSKNLLSAVSSPLKNPIRDHKNFRAVFINRIANKSAKISAKKDKKVNWYSLLRKSMVSVPSVSFKRLNPTASAIAMLKKNIAFINTQITDLSDLPFQ